MLTSLPERTPKNDRILRWPFALATAVPLFLIAMYATRLWPFESFFFILYILQPLLAVWGIGTICATILAICAASRKAWRRAASAAIFPVIVAAIVLPLLLLGLNFLYLAGSLFRLEFLRSSYLPSVRAHPLVDGQRIVIFIWEVDFGPSQGAVYDESDEIALPIGKQSPAWHKQADHTLLSCESYDAWPAGGHFYLVDFGC